MPAKFSKEFKDQAVEKCINGSADKSIKQIAEELNIGYSTLQKWLKNASVMKPHSRSSSDHWSAAEKLAIVSKALSLSEPELGAYCREQGIYTHEITAWQKEFESMTKPNEQVKIEREKNRELKAKNKALEKEIKRKDKALAEAAALLVLQKKVQAFFEEAEES